MMNPSMRCRKEACWVPLVLGDEMGVPFMGSGG